jgi:UDPglucose 6-dehydrogenase
MPYPNEKICVVGLWHLGTVTSACFADLGYQVVGVDENSGRVKSLNDGSPPLFEPGLAELVSKHLLSGRLRFTSHLHEGVQGASYVVIAQDTPVNENDELDLVPVTATIDALAACIEDRATIIISSQLPIGTCQVLIRRLQLMNPNLHFSMACVPENLRLGQAIDRFLKPDFLVLGANSKATMDRVEALYSPLPGARVRMDLRTAEMTKHAINAYLATCISFGNELANLCDEVGADAFQIIQTLKLDSRVSANAPLLPGLGFAGGTLARDLTVLKSLSAQHGYSAPLLNGVSAVNEHQNTMVISHLERLIGTLRDRTIGVLGLTYKPGTSTLRRSAAIEIIRNLLSRGAAVKAFDPKADPSELEGYRQEFSLCTDAYAVAKDADALVLITPWPEFKELDLARIRGLMHNPVMFDAPNMLEPSQLVREGFTYHGIGRGFGSSPR